MKTLDAGLAAHIASGVTTLAWCWKITRRDGVVFGFTNHDRALSFDGVEYESESGLIPSELRDASDLSVDAQDAEGYLSSDRITETDIVDGLWDDAAVEVWQVNWSDVSQRLLRRRGALGQIRRGRLSFVAEVRSMSHVLSQQVGRTYMSNCDARLGDSRCKVNLEALRVSGTASGLQAGRMLLGSGAVAGFGSDYFTFGLLTWTTGANAGRTIEIMRHDQAEGFALLQLLEEPVRSPEVGDAFTIVPGCGQTAEDCRTKFSNIVNFRGFPHIPGSDSMIRYANRGDGENGDPL